MFKLMQGTIQVKLQKMVDLNFSALKQSRTTELISKVVVGRVYTGHKQIHNILYVELFVHVANEQIMNPNIYTIL